jgi:hypothetical protein
MCPNLTQPEEIDLVLKQMAQFDLQIDKQRRDAESFAKTTQTGRNTTNCSAYRAEYMKTHKLDP